MKYKFNSSIIQILIFIIVYISAEKLICDLIKSSLSQVVVAIESTFTERLFLAHLFQVGVRQFLEVGCAARG